jgi:hypothetical protein
MHLDPQALVALAGLDPMPRTPLAINPCPEGYQLQSIGGRLMCVLEGAEALDPLAARMSMAESSRTAMAYSRAGRGARNINPQVFGGSPATGGG